MVWRPRCCSNLAFRRKWVATVAIALTNSPIPTMNKQFCALVLSNITSTVNCFFLCVYDHSRTRGTGPFHRPAAIMRNYVLISFRHFNLQNMWMDVRIGHPIFVR